MIYTLFAFSRCYGALGARLIAVIFATMMPAFEATFEPKRVLRCRVALLAAVLLMMLLPRHA